MKKYSVVMTKYSVKVFHSKQLKGLTGDNGEEFVVFVMIHKSLIDSGWKWFRSAYEANHFAKEMKGKLDGETTIL